MENNPEVISTRSPGSSGHVLVYQTKRLILRGSFSVGGGLEGITRDSGLET